MRNLTTSTESTPKRMPALKFSSYGIAEPWRYGELDPQWLGFEFGRF
jgi:hypothetical protein